MKILLGVSGGIAAYKSLELVRMLVKNGHQVQVVMTASAKQFIQPLSFQALTGQKVRDSLFDAEQEAGMGHIELARWADVIIIAPATANLLAKLNHGFADDLLTTLCLATDRPIVFAPAMNRLMWANQATQNNVADLVARGWHLIEPGEGEQACGEIGAGRLAEPYEIYDFVVEKFFPRDSNQIWLGKKVLITAGPTFENIDPVRFLGNRSSGKMGYALAQIAADQGAEVTLISGPVSLPKPARVNLISVRSAEQMLAKVQENLSGQEVVIGAAAVADFRVAEIADQKLKKSDDQQELHLKLVKNPDIIGWVAEQKSSLTNRPFVVGFAAETEKVTQYARAKLEAKNLDMICANQVGENLGFESDDNAVTVITKNQAWLLSTSSKVKIAEQILDLIADNL